MTRLSLACEAGGIGIWQFNPTENTLIWDAQMFHLYGITPDTFLGTYEVWQSGLHPDDIAKTS